MRGHLRYADPDFFYSQETTGIWYKLWCCCVHPMFLYQLSFYWTIVVSKEHMFRPTNTRVTFGRVESAKVFKVE